MRPDVFQIQFPNKPVLAYFPGEIVEGVVQVMVGEVQEQQDNVCKGIKLTFKGKSKVQWSEQRGNTRQYFFGSETYFEEKVYLLGAGETEVVIPPGLNAFPFQFILPQGIPSSFSYKEDNGDFGKVEYKVQAEMIKGILKSNHMAKVRFTVNSVVDLNIEPMVGFPVECSRSKNMCCLCCKSGAVGFTLTLPRCGYVSGEFIRFTSEFSNQSGKVVKKVSASLIQRVTLIAMKCSTDLYRTICSVNGPEVGPGDSESWVPDNILQIPPLPPTALAGGCSTIKVHYFLKIEVHLPGASINLRHLIPIVIGSIPLRDTFQEISRHQSNVNYSSHADMIQSSSPPPYFQVNYNYPDLPPPTYGEAILQPDYPAAAAGGMHNPNFEQDRAGGGSSSYDLSDPNAIPLATVSKSNAFSPKYITYA